MAPCDRPDRLHVSRAARLAATVYLTALVALSVVHVLAPQREGLIALTQILAPHLFVVGLIIGLLVVLLGRSSGAGRALRLALLTTAIVGLARFGPGLVSLPRPAPPPGASIIDIVSWNLEFSGPFDTTIVSTLGGSEADIVGLQELDPHDAALIASDPMLISRFPYRALHPEQGPFGSGLLSIHPIVESGWLEESNAVWARLELGKGRQFVAVTAHPPPGRISLPFGFSPSARDAGIVELRSALVDALLADGERVVLFGDFNVTDREPAYADLSRGLRDVHAEVGMGPGSTWRPGSIEWLPFGVLRIDLVFTGPGVQPLAISADCNPGGSDHCLLRARVAVE